MERTSKRQVSSYGGRNEELTKMREEETEMMVEEEEDPLMTSHIFVFAHTCCLSQPHEDKIPSMTDSLEGTNTAWKSRRCYWIF
jgi:hypothetical protein